MKNPFTYAAGSIGVQRNGQDVSEWVSCSCIAGDKQFCFNKEEIRECWTSGEGSGKIYEFNNVSQ
jgi:hypothetical protein